MPSPIYYDRFGHLASRSLQAPRTPILAASVASHLNPTPYLDGHTPPLLRIPGFMVSPCYFGIQKKGSYPPPRNFWLLHELIWDPVD